MKKTGIILAALTLTVSAFGQGQVNFNNRITGVGAFVAPIYGVNPAAPTVRIAGNSTANGGTANYTGVPLLQGSGFSAALWEGPADSATGLDFTQISAITGFRTATTLGGIIQTPAVVNTATASGSRAAFQVRAWDNKGGTIANWADALAAGQRGETATGFSDTFSMTVGGGSSPAPNITGLRSFNLTIVPEPSLIALGALGFGALLLRRRK